MKYYVWWEEVILLLWGACGTIPLSRPNYDWDLYDFGLITCSYCHLSKPQLQINDGSAKRVGKIPEYKPNGAACPEE